MGSQEGAFENVRVNYSGDQGQTIRQLITSHVLRRISMCPLTSPNSRRQHLAISNEKGKVTILQLSALLKQAHSNKRKLTLTVSYIMANPRLVVLMCFCSVADVMNGKAHILCCEIVQMSIDWFLTNIIKHVS